MAERERAKTSVQQAKFGNQIRIKTLKMNKSKHFYFSKSWEMLLSEKEE